MSKVAAALALATRLKRLKCGHGSPISASDSICNLVGLLAHLHCSVSLTPGLNDIVCKSHYPLAISQDSPDNVEMDFEYVGTHLFFARTDTHARNQVSRTGTNILWPVRIKNYWYAPLFWYAYNTDSNVAVVRPVSARCQACPWYAWTGRYSSWRKLRMRPAFSSRRFSSATACTILPCAHFLTRYLFNRT